MIMFCSAPSRVLRCLQHQPSAFICRRFASEVRVRFAPSPTGYLHLGGLRTALYNYLFARNRDGKFLLRIEDTDQTRLVPGATKRLIEDLLWTGIQIDEGPGDFGGAYGPYVQSERMHIYTEAVQRLLENGTAYHCFCTERRLDLLRKEAVRARQVPRYDNKCRHLTPQQVAEHLERRTPFCVRFKLAEHGESFEDIIYGRVQHNVAETEGDPVIVKTEQCPTYHFANVVDDHLMGVTHVLRGIEWQISTTKHLLLYKAFGWQPPEYGHLPLLVNADGTKMSKRQGDIAIKEFREKGYFPEALLNYVVSSGGGFTCEPRAKHKVSTLSELEAQFNIDRVNSHPSRLNPELLDSLNRLQIERMLEQPSTMDQLVRQVQTLIKDVYPNYNLDLNAAHIANVLRWSTKRLSLVQELTSSQLSFLWVKPAHFELRDLDSSQLQRLLTQLEALDCFDTDTLNATLKGFAEKERIKFAPLMRMLRALLSGLKEGPGVAEMMNILGSTIALQRIRDALHAIEAAPPTCSPIKNAQTVT